MKGRTPKYLRHDYARRCEAYERAMEKMDPPPRVCPCCGHSKWWRLKTNWMWVCEVCHPPIPSEDEIVRKDTSPPEELR